MYMCIMAKGQNDVQMTFKRFCLNLHTLCSQLYPSQAQPENVSFSWLAATPFAQKRLKRYLFLKSALSKRIEQIGIPT